MALDVTFLVVTLTLSGLEQQFGQFLRCAHHGVMPGLDREVFPPGVKLDALLGAVEIRIKRLDAVDVGARQKFDAAPCGEVGQALRREVAAIRMRAQAPLQQRMK